MATITIRNLDENVKQGLRLRSAQHGCLLESAVRKIQSDAVTSPARPVRTARVRPRGKWSGRFKPDEWVEVSWGA